MKKKIKIILLLLTLSLSRSGFGQLEINEMPDFFLNPEISEEGNTSYMQDNTNGFFICDTAPYDPSANEQSPHVYYDNYWENYWAGSHRNIPDNVNFNHPIKQGSNCWDRPDNGYVYTNHGYEYSNAYAYKKSWRNSSRFSSDDYLHRRYNGAGLFSSGISSYQGTSTGPGPNGGYPGTPRGVYKTYYIPNY